MKNWLKVGGETILLSMMFFLSDYTFAQTRVPRFVHRLEIETRPAYIFPTNPFLRGENESLEPVRSAFSAHLKYAFQFFPHSCADRIYGGVYQGVGVARYSFGFPHQLGKPAVLYLFQGARIVRFLSRLSLNYEWNLGISNGWKPYDPDKNSFNKAIGSKMNAYINTNFYLDWQLSKLFDLNAGIALTHFSNGNTRIPNAGLNTVGMKIGLVYHFKRTEDLPASALQRALLPEFPRHVSYDLVVFGSWRRKGVALGDEQVASPEAYTVVGFNFAPMYHIGYKLRLGVSLDGVYDGSANIYTNDHYAAGEAQEFLKPSVNKQLALGLSGRVEYVMPFFTVGLGLGANLLHGGGDLKAFYQVLALKIEVSRHSFLHVGYNLQNFRTPSFLMLGIGFRFHNRYPSL